MVKGNDYLYKNQEVSFALITKTPIVLSFFAFVKYTDSI